MSIGQAKSDAADRELVRDLERTKLDIEVQKLIFGASPEGAQHSRLTRRLLALMIGITFVVCTILCAVFPTIPLVTFAASSGAGTQFSLLWGLVVVPTLSAGTTVVITTGHMLIVAFAMMGACFGFYFSPTFEKRR
tara:strand:- start:20217 stop:20624 length:408 start_codon:yes stop_codon:yes gene_type:complete